MITKKNIVDQILMGGKMLLDDAVTKAMAVKQIKNKDAIRAWKNTFAQNGVITRDATGTYVSPKVAEVAPVAPAAPVVAPAAPVVQEVPVVSAPAPTTAVAQVATTAVVEVKKE